MEINEVNKKIYEDAFISNGEYGDLNSWKPSIDEREIETFSSDEKGNYFPATPLGYRDYLTSRKEGLSNILTTESARVFTYDDAHNIKREDNIIKQYDKVTIDGTDYVVTGDDDEKFYIATSSSNLYYINYVV